MTVTQYVGARYVPEFAEPTAWNKESAYEPLTIVLYEGNSYTSRQSVPAGIEITNETYWALTGNYNAQIEAYRKEVKAFDARINDNTNAITSSKKNPLHIFDAIEIGCDNTGKSDCSTIINEFLSKYPACYLYFPEGTYLLENVVNIPSGVTFAGASMSYSLFNCTGNGLKLYGSHGVCLKDFQLEGSLNSDSVTGLGIHMENTDVCYLNNIVVQNFATGILNECTSAQHGNNTFNYVGINVTKTMSNTTYGLFIKGRTVSNYYNDMFIASNLGGRSSKFTAVNVENSQDQHFNYVDTANGFYGFRFTSDSKVSNLASDIYMTNCVTDSFWYSIFCVNNTVINTGFHDNCAGDGTDNYNIVFSGDIEGCIITNSTFCNLGSNTDNLNCIVVQAPGLKVANCNIANFGKGIALEGSNCTITGNNFYNCSDALIGNSATSGHIISGNKVDSFSNKLINTLGNLSKSIVTGNIGVIGGATGTNIVDNNITS